MSSFCKSYSHFFSKNISIYAIFDDQNFNDMLTNNIVSFKQLGPGCVANSLDNGQITHSAASNLDLPSLPSPVCLNTKGKYGG